MERFGLESSTWPSGFSPAFSVQGFWRLVLPGSTALGFETQHSESSLVGSVPGRL